MEGLGFMLDGGLEGCLRAMLGRGYSRIGVFVYIGDCLYICMIYILSVVCPVGEGDFCGMCAVGMGEF